MGDRVVQLARELLAFAQLDLVALPEPGPGPVTDGGAERCGEQEERAPTIRSARVPATTSVRTLAPRMKPIPIAASRPDPQRSSAYGSMSTHAVVTRIAIGSSGPSVYRPAAVSSSEVPPNAITVTSSGWVRRQSSATDRPTQTTRPAGTPDEIRAEDRLENCRDRDHGQQQPVPPDPCGRIGSPGLSQEGVDGAAHVVTVDRRSGSRHRPEVRTSIGRTADASVSHRPMFTAAARRDDRRHVLRPVSPRPPRGPPPIRHRRCVARRRRARGRRLGGIRPRSGGHDGCARSRLRAGPRHARRGGVRACGHHRAGGRHAAGWRRGAAFGRSGQAFGGRRRPAERARRPAPGLTRRPRGRHPRPVSDPREAEPRRPRAPEGVCRRAARRVAAADRARRRPVLRLRGVQGRDKRADRHRRRGGHPARRVRVGDRDGPADRDGDIRARARDQLDVAHRIRDPDPRLRAADREHDRPRRRHRLRPADGDPASRAPRGGDGGL